MVPPSALAFLTQAPAGRHLAQIHRDPAAVAAAASVFVEAGLRRGEGVVAIGSVAATELMLGRVAHGDIDVEGAQRAGRLVLLDSAATLERLIRRGKPDGTEFRGVFGGVLEGVRGLRLPGTRVYGDLVNDLWRAGRTAAAIRLEEWWNELVQQYQVCLFCCYLLDWFDEASYASPLHEIGRTHSEILPTDEDERFQAAVDAASRDVLGGPLSATPILSGRADWAGEPRLPPGLRAVLWLKRNMPATCGQVLERARRYYATP